MRRLPAVVLAALLAAACSPSAEGPQATKTPAFSFAASDITGATFGGDFALADGDGKVRRLADFRGRAVLVFFGFTQCPDVCPTALARLADLRKRLGADADKVQVVFVTLDPERDSGAVIREYVKAFDPGFIGLRGEPDAIAATAKDFKVFYQKVPGSAPDRYTFNHSTSIYAFDPAGRLRLLIQSSVTPEQMVADVRALLAGR
jgi:protein SCO1/2